MARCRGPDAVAAAVDLDLPNERNSCVLAGGDADLRDGGTARWHDEDPIDDIGWGCVDDRHVDGHRRPGQVANRCARRRAPSDGELIPWPTEITEVIESPELHDRSDHRGVRNRRLISRAGRLYADRTLRCREP